MTDNELKELQKELDTKKYYQSSTAQQDLSGMMDYCDKCFFKRRDSENENFRCTLDRISVETNQVCAKNYMRNKEYDELRKQKQPRTTSGTRKSKSKCPNL